MSTKRIYLEETREYINKICQIFTEDDRRGFEFKRNKVKWTMENMLFAKFGHLKPAYDIETALKKAEEIKKDCFIEKPYPKEEDFFGAESRIDKFWFLFKVKDFESLILNKNDIVLKTRIYAKYTFHREKPLRTRVSVLEFSDDW